MTYRDDQDAQLARADALQVEVDQLTSERDELRTERDALRDERDSLQTERARLSRELERQPAKPRGPATFTLLTGAVTGAALVGGIAVVVAKQPDRSDTSSSKASVARVVLDATPAPGQDELRAAAIELRACVLEHQLRVRELLPYADGPYDPRHPPEAEPVRTTRTSAGGTSITVTNTTVTVGGRAFNPGNSLAHDDERCADQVTPLLADPSLSEAGRAALEAWRVAAAAGFTLRHALGLYYANEDYVEDDLTRGRAEWPAIVAAADDEDDARVALGRALGRELDGRMTATLADFERRDGRAYGWWILELARRGDELAWATAEPGADLAALAPRLHALVEAQALAPIEARRPSRDLVNAAEGTAAAKDAWAATKALSDARRQLPVEQVLP